jgi:hypothetical protein
MTAPCPSVPLFTLDQHYGLNLLDLACALGYADALVSMAQRMQRSRTMSGSVTTGQRVQDGGGLCLLAHQRLQHPPDLSSGTDRRPHTRTGGCEDLEACNHADHYTATPRSPPPLSRRVGYGDGKVLQTEGGMIV